jgi:enoyl-CoA hydratase/carnithine racemase
MTGTVLSETLEGGVRLITLNRPARLNAIVPDLLDELVQAIDAANADEAIGAIVLTGAGRAFCAGDDLKEFASQVGDEAETRGYIDRIQDVTRAILFGDKPVIGAIRGWAVGGGLEWVINCDFAIAVEGTRFFFPEIGWGVFVTGGVTALLPRLVGLQKARELIMLGERFDADQAREWGLVWRVVADADLRDEALSLGRRIATLPRTAVRDLRRCLTGREASALQTALQAETDATVRGFMDPETMGRISKFG